MGAWSTDIDIEQGATFTLGFRYCDPVLDDNGNVVMEPPASQRPKPGNPKDLRRCTARMQIKKSLKDTTAAVTATSLPPSDDPTDGSGRIVLADADLQPDPPTVVTDPDNPLTGRIDIILTDADTDKIDFTKGVYDLEIEYPLVPGELRPRVERILEGAVNITLNVTRIDTEFPVG